MKKVIQFTIVVMVAALGVFNGLCAGWAQGKKQSPTNKGTLRTVADQAEEVRVPVRFPDLVVCITTINTLEAGQAIPDCRVLVKNIGIINMNIVGV